ncbi:MAG: PASTA domain-containing protein [Spirochaetes bacterium]|nr:PASTA domain-containing protein [Spirochaetota bacterium]
MNQKVFKRRVYIAGLICATVTLVFIVRLFNLHFSGRVVVPGPEKMEAHRGWIRDSGGYILALSMEKYSLFANPEEIKDPAETASVLSRYLPISSKAIIDKLNKKKRFIWIKRKIDDAAAGQIRKIGMPGIYFKKEYQRMYPHDSLASNIVGFVGVDNNGLAGIEYAFDRELSGADASVPFRSGVPFGKNITLTIDRFVQHIAESEIGRAVAFYRAKQGTAVVIEVKTGRILALAKSPGFNPNAYYDYPAFPRRNFGVIDSFEPGSTMKIISMAAVLERNPAVINNRYTCNGWIDISDARINCTGVHGTIGINDVIRHSCNVGVIEAMKTIRKKDLYDMLTRFGFGKKTGVDLPAETEGIFRPPDRWSGLSKYSIAIGQEISVTSLQLAAAYCAVANGGVYLPPVIIDSIEEEDGTIVRRYAPPAGKPVISKGISDRLMKMMRGVVESGTGRRAASANYCVAGKTGTSQKFIRAKGYSDRVLSSFIGVAPCDDPAVCILVVIDDPADRLSGGEIATPVFAALVDRVLIRMGEKKERLKAREPAQRKVKPPVFNGKTMPDFTGLRIRESLGLLIEMKTRVGVAYTLHGSGSVFRQKPAPGAAVEQGATIDIYFR